jgi:hypothetical protein
MPPSTGLTPYPTLGMAYRRLGHRSVLITLKAFKACPKLPSELSHQPELLFASNPARAQFKSFQNGLVKSYFPRRR